MSGASLSDRLFLRKSQGNPVRVGLVGAGKFGTMFLSQVRTTVGLQLTAVADLDPANATAALIRAGWNDARIVEATTAGALVEALQQGLRVERWDHAILIRRGPSSVQ